jgi:hypothetical protein
LVVVAIAIGLIFGGVFMVLTDVRVDDRTQFVFDEPDHAGSNADGTVYIDTVLKDRHGDIVRRIDPGIDIVPFNILDPDTDTQVSRYEVNVVWECSGSSINWATLAVSGDFTFVKYVGVDDVGNPAQQTFNEVKDTDSSTAQEGRMTFGTDLEPLIPNPMYVDGGGGENFDQKTSDPHAMIFVFSSDFSISVNDDFGNVYDEDYNVYIELRLTWEGSTFNVNWGEDDGETTTVVPTDTTTTTTKPPVKYPPDDVTSNTDMDNLESNELVELTQGNGAAAATIFGGTVQEDIGIVLIGVGMVMFALALLLPAVMPKR